MFFDELEEYIEVDKLKVRFVYLPFLPVVRTVACNGHPQMMLGKDGVSDSVARVRNVLKSEQDVRAHAFALQSLSQNTKRHCFDLVEVFVKLVH